MSVVKKYRGSPLLAELYDLVPSYHARPDSRFYLQEYLRAGGPALELGCGTGRVLIPAAREGRRITGLDLSEDMLARCRSNLSEEVPETSKRVRLVTADMTDFELDESFSLITIPFRPFQHLIEIDDQMSCLHCIHRHLSPGGRLIFDVFQVNFSYIAREKRTEEVEDTPEFELPDGRKMRRCSQLPRHCRAEQYMDVELIYYVTSPQGKVETVVDAFPFRYFFRYELVHLLDRCGFRTTALYGDFDRSPLIDTSPEMIFVAEKRE